MPPEKKGFWGTIGSFFSGVYNSISNGVSTTATYVKDATVSAYNATTEYIQEKTRNYYWYENGERQGTANDPKGIIGYEYNSTIV